MAAKTSTTIKRNAGDDETSVSNDPEGVGAKIQKTGSTAEKEGAPPALTILDLPNELLFAIFCFLDHRSLAKCARVCTKFNELCNNPKCFSRYIVIPGLHNKSDKYITWLLSRSSPLKFENRFDTYSDFTKAKLKLWRNLEELILHETDLIYCEGSLTNLKSITLHDCISSCESFENLVRDSKALQRVTFDWVMVLCDKTNETCKKGVLHFIDLNTRNTTVKEVHIRSTSDISLPDLNRLSVCTNLTALTLYETNNKEPYTEEHTRAMEMIAQNCTQLEKIKLTNLPYVTDKILDTLLEKCVNLRELELALLPNITEMACIKALDFLPQLHAIIVGACPRFSETRLQYAMKRSCKKQQKRMSFASRTAFMTNHTGNFFGPQLRENMMDSRFYTKTFR